nr:subtilisin-like serine protease [Calothrix sp. MO_167.B12]
DQMLQDCCDRFPTWKPNQFGAGIVNAEKLMAAPLPDNVERSVIKPGLALQQYTPVESDGCETFLNLFESQLSGDEPEEVVLPQALLNKHLAELLQTTEAELPQRLQEVEKELAFHFAVDPELYEQFAKSLHPHQPSLMRMLKGEATQPSTTQNPIRERLLTQGVSERLNQKLGVAD